MNRNTGILAGIIILLIIIAGVFMYSQGGLSTTATSTPIGTTGDVTTETPGTTKTAGSPLVTTNANVTPSDTTAVVVGGVVPNGAFTTYWYEYGTASLDKTSASQNIGSGFAELAAPAYITGLTKDTTYSFRAVAQNQFGTTKGATYTFHTTVGTPAPVGSVPAAQTLAATGIARTSANLSGQVTPNKASTTYWFEYGITQSLGGVSARQSVGSGSAAVAASFALADLNPATTYYFRLNAQNQFGTVNGTILNFKTSGPAASPAATAPVATTQVPSPVATTTATLRGTVNPGDAQTTYWFEYSTDSLLGSVLLKTTPQKSVGAGSDTVSVEANLTGLKSKTTYYYRTVAQNSAGTVRGDKQTFRTN